MKGNYGRGNTVNKKDTVSSLKRQLTNLKQIRNESMKEKEVAERELGRKKVEVSQIDRRIQDILRRLKGKDEW